MRVRGPRVARRRGAALVEAAIVLLVFLSIFLGMVDLSIVVLRRHVLSQAARQAARQAIVHGSLAPNNPSLGWMPWGPAAYGPVAANTADPRAEVVADSLAAIDPSTVQVSYRWIDGGNRPEDRVQVTLTTRTQTLIGFVLGGQTIDLQASSTMPIAH